MDVVTINLGDRDRNLRYRWGSVREICRVLTRLQPGERPDKVTQNRLWGLLAERDPDATALTLFHGLKWEDTRLRADQMEDMLESFVENGGDLDRVYDAIVDAMVNAGLVKLPNRGATQNGHSGNGQQASGS